jgi:hypothetical protein
MYNPSDVMCKLLRAMCTGLHIARGGDVLIAFLNFTTFNSEQNVNY